MSDNKNQKATTSNDVAAQLEKFEQKKNQTISVSPVVEEENTQGPVKVVAVERCFFRHFREKGATFSLPYDQVYIDGKDEKGKPTKVVHPALRVLKNGEKPSKVVEHIGNPYGKPPALRNTK